MKQGEAESYRELAGCWCVRVAFCCVELGEGKPISHAMELIDPFTTNFILCGK